jgi:2-keto-3-deoxy-L-rhamnonate aldolase RhmA
VIAAARRHGKTGACLVTTQDDARRWMAKGYRFIIFSTDVILLTSSFRAGIEGLR